MHRNDTQRMNRAGPRAEAPDLGARIVRMARVAAAMHMAAAVCGGEDAGEGAPLDLHALRAQEAGGEE